jgi:valyl-tRNA synthetase
MMQPQLAERIERLTRKNFPDGIPPYGTDALRFTFAALAATGRDIKLDAGRIEGYRNFCNKLWNAARYVLSNTEGQDCGAAQGSANVAEGRTPGATRQGTAGEIELSLADKWIQSRLQQTVRSVTDAIEAYRFDHAAQAIYEFTWNQYCDWYIELSKTVLNDDHASEAAKRGTRKTLVTVLESLLRLAHPLIPFITEEIWQSVAPLAAVSGNTVMTQPYPLFDEALVNTYVEDEMQWVMDFILGIRKIKGEMNISPGKHVPVLLSHCSPIDEQRALDHRAYLDFLARTESITVLAESEEEPEAATALVGDMRVLIPMAGLIDKEAELKRLTKEVARFEGEIERLEKKLSNPGFVNKAPEAVVQKEREKLVEAEKALANLQGQLEKIRKL